MKEIIKTKDAPAAIGPYSQAVRKWQFLFVSGQLPINPSTGSFVGDGITEQARQCLENLKAILEAGGASLDDVVKVVVFLMDMDDFQEMNIAYGDYFKSNFPARCCVEVARLPKDARIEIEAIAICAD